MYVCAEVAKIYGENESLSEIVKKGEYRTVRYFERKTTLTELSL